MKRLRPEACSITDMRRHALPLDFGPGLPRLIHAINMEQPPSWTLSQSGAPRPPRSSPTTLQDEVASGLLLGRQAGTRRKRRSSRTGALSMRHRHGRRRHQASPEGLGCAAPSRLGEEHRVGRAGDALGFAQALEEGVAALCVSKRITQLQAAQRPERPELGGGHAALPARLPRRLDGLDRELRGRRSIFKAIAQHSIEAQTSLERRLEQRGALRCDLMMILPLSGRRTLASGRGLARAAALRLGLFARRRLKGRGRRRRDVIRHLQLRRPRRRRIGRSGRAHARWALAGVALVCGRRCSRRRCGRHGRGEGRSCCTWLRLRRRRRAVTAGRPLLSTPSAATGQHERHRAEGIHRVCAAARGAARRAARLLALHPPWARSTAGRWCLGQSQRLLLLGDASLLCQTLGLHLLPVLLALRLALGEYGGLAVGVGVEHAAQPHWPPIHDLRISRRTAFWRGLASAGPLELGDQRIRLGELGAQLVDLGERVLVVGVCTVELHLRALLRRLRCRHPILRALRYPVCLAHRLGGERLGSLLGGDGLGGGGLGLGARLIDRLKDGGRLGSRHRPEAERLAPLCRFLIVGIGFLRLLRLLRRGARRVHRVRAGVEAALGRGCKAGAHLVGGCRRLRRHPVQIVWVERVRSGRLGGGIHGARARLEAAFDRRRKRGRGLMVGAGEATKRRPFGRPSLRRHGTARPLGRF
mmetsp:Transcript_41874/g.110365  ORF Transcript_41874/g.110365 Transcript_41874/m.110365 type:complete len:701 (+) Transcript_41874:122-2224(+)